MKVTPRILLLVGFIMMVHGDVSQAIPNVWGEWNWQHTEPVHIVVAPGGGGLPLDAAELFGGVSTDATIRVQLWVQDDSLEDPQPPTPVANFPGEDIWLEVSGLSACVGQVNADGPTDPDGWFTFSGPLGMGGWNDPAGAPPTVYVVVSGNPLQDQFGQYISPTLALNSPDINADLVVNLSDVALFAPDYFGPYAFRSDFIWDGVVNLSDVVWVAVLMGDECP